MEKLRPRWFRLHRPSNLLVLQLLAHHKKAHPRRPLVILWFLTLALPQAWQCSHLRAPGWPWRCTSQSEATENSGPR